MEPTKTRPPEKPTATASSTPNPKPEAKPTTAQAAADVATHVAGDARELASKVVDQAKGFIGDQVGERKEKSAGQIDKVAEALHRTSENLADTVASPYVERAAAALDRVSGSVRNASFSDAISATERFARRDPLLFMGSAFAIGFLAARFLKSSAPEVTQHEDTTRHEVALAIPRRGPGSGRSKSRRQRGRDGGR